MPSARPVRAFSISRRRPRGSCRAEKKRLTAECRHKEVIPVFCDRIFIKPLVKDTTLRANSKQSTDDQAAAKSDKKRNTSLRLNTTTLKTLKRRAVEDETSVQKIIETLVEGYLDQVGR